MKTRGRGGGGLGGGLGAGKEGRRGGRGRRSEGGELDVASSFLPSSPSLLHNKHILSFLQTVRLASYLIKRKQILPPVHTLSKPFTLQAFRPLPHQSSHKEVQHACLKLLIDAHLEVLGYARSCWDGWGEGRRGEGRGGEGRSDVGEVGGEMKGSEVGLNH